MLANRLSNKWTSLGVFLAAAALAAGAPLLHHPIAIGASTSHPFPGWPTHYEGRRLVALPMSEREAAFGRDFPGKIARFSDGEREIIVRYVAEPTRRLHPAADCLKAVGFSIATASAQRGATGAMMSCIKAERRGHSLDICEEIRNDHGEQWPDVSAWYWSTMFGGARGPWWSFVVAKPNRTS